MVKLLYTSRLQTTSKVAKIQFRNRSITTSMSAKMGSYTPQKSSETANMAYSHCKTRIINLVDLNIPESATESEYKQLFNKISVSGTPEARSLTDAINSISQGISPPVAFPTETVYGLGADATNHASTAGIFAAKGRPSDNPLIVHVASRAHLERLTGEPIPKIYHDLVKDHWPGPLTILVPIPKDSKIFAKNVHPSQTTIGFRVPSSKYARFFISATGKPIAAPSANSSGKPSPTTAQHVMDDLKGKINFILNGGTCDVGVESTVVDGLCDPPLILRPGGLSQDDLIAHGHKYNNSWLTVDIGYKVSHGTKHDHNAETNGDVNGFEPILEEAPRAPGMKYKHYAPQGRMILFEGSTSLEKVHAELDALVNTAAAAAASPTTAATVNGSADEDISPNTKQEGEALRIAILTSTTWSTDAVLCARQPNQDQKVESHPRHSIHTIHLGTTPREIARNLFAALRTCDDLGCRFILAEAPSREVVERNLDEEGLRKNRVELAVAEQSLHQFDAVLERMRKAASLIVVS